MTIKRYEGQFVHEVIEQIRSELGPEAVVLHTRWRNPAGLKKLLSRPQVEVWAAEPDAAPPDPEPAAPLANGPVAARALALKQSLAANGAGDDEFLFGDDLEAPPRRPKRAARRPEPAADAGLHEALRRLEGKVDSLSSHAGANGHGGGRRAALLRAGVDPEVADELLEAAREQTVVELLWQTFRVTGEWEPASARTVALVGASGVGKTTAAAKLAARYGVAGGRRVLLLSCDAQRVGTFEQMRAYAELMELPVAVARTPAELRRVLKSARDKHDLVLLDTPAVCESAIGRLTELLEAAQPDQIHAVVAATCRPGDVRRHVTALQEALPLTAALVTKLDETRTPGVVVDLAWRHRLPISFLSDGPDVPGDLRCATGEALVRLAWSSRLADPTEVPDALAIR